MEICKEENCTGCMSCYNICPKDAIKMQYNQYGIVMPVIDNNLCINCSLCKKTCPANEEISKNLPKEAYATWSLDKLDRKTSSSGGIASVFSNHIIENNGICFGSAFDTKIRLKHLYALKTEELKKFKGSKYVQSYIGDTYKEVKQFLSEGKDVLFIGTPCQIDGLNRYLSNKDYPKLITVDLVCHGVPSQKYLDDHISYILKKKNIEVDKMTFRGEEDFKFTLYNNEKIVYKKDSKTDYYFYAFLRGLIYRDSCYNCKYATQYRISDITIGDFWGIGKDKPFEHKDVSGGISLVLINTKKGKDFFEEVKDKIFYEKREIQEAINGNAQLRKPSITHKNREKFINAYLKNGFENAVQKCLKKEICIENIKILVKRYLRKLNKRH